MTQVSHTSLRVLRVLRGGAQIASIHTNERVHIDVSDKLAAPLRVERCGVGFGVEEGALAGALLDAGVPLGLKAGVTHTSVHLG
jgi:hypothetical protein